MLLLGKKLLFISIVFLISGILCLVCCIRLSGESGDFQNEVQFTTNFGTTKRFSSSYNFSKAHRRQKFYPINIFSNHVITRSLLGIMCAKKENFVSELCFQWNQNFWELFRLSENIYKSASFIEQSKYFIDHFRTFFRSITHLVLTQLCSLEIVSANGR